MLAAFLIAALVNHKEGAYLHGAGRLALKVIGHKLVYS